MKQLLFALFVILALSGCKPVADNPDGYYVVTLRAGGYITCEGIQYNGDWLQCDTHLFPIHRGNVWDVKFVYEDAK